ncbi:HET domain protein [Rutstroemia sp. NJR-2017a BBW]|nr:HET domain protein [Rutstroemia sp. NJR-2017a BBW]
MSFKYSPLDPSVDGIRLLVLEPGAREEIPKCTLKHVTFGERPKYEALSYTWGDETQRRDILLGGHSFSVTKNLYDALCCLRHPSEPRQLWTDAICINQTDIPERNRQLPIMASIYGRAQTVLVWLGLYETNSKAQPVLDGLRLGSDDGLMKAICGNPYWERLWIIQEVASARKLRVHLDEDQMDWDEFLSLLHRSPYFKSSRAQVLERHWVTKYEKFQALEHLLEAHKHALCKDPKDKVYGLLGLDPGWLHFPVHYQKSLYETLSSSNRMLRTVLLYADFLSASL